MSAPKVTSKAKYISPRLPDKIRDLWKSDPSENSVKTVLALAGDLIQELIDLRATPQMTGEPTPEQIEAAAKALREEFLKFGGGDNTTWQDYEPEARAALNAAGAISDAAIERYEKSERERSYWRRRYKSMHKRAKSAEAERDAALEAVKRVRGIHEPVEIEPSSTICRECSFQLPNQRFFGKVTEWPCDTLKTLDGAPEPGREVQYGRRNRETGALHWITGDPRDDWWHENQDEYEHVKRYTSPPLPVEGESK